MELLDLAREAATAAAVLLRERFGAPRTGVGTKSTATDMVTDADRAAELLIISRLLGARPDDGVLAEESGEVEGTSGLRWVIDPLDGTTNFVFGIPHIAVSIACEDADGVRVAVVYDVMRQECFAAERGGGARLDGEPISATEKHEIADCLAATGFHYDAGIRASGAGILPGVLPRIRDIRRAGAATLDLAWVACGRLDGYFETPLARWDVAAGSLLVAEAGGRVGELRWPHGPGTLAAGAHLYDGLRALVQGAIDGVLPPPG